MRMNAVLRVHFMAAAQRGPAKRQSGDSSLPKRWPQCQDAPLFLPFFARFVWQSVYAFRMMPA